MAQATEKCVGQIGICAMRVTALNEDGTVADGPNNAYVVAQPMSLEFSLDLEAGDDKILVGGCDCIGLRYRSRDKSKGFTFTFTDMLTEPSLWSIMLGSSLIYDDSDIPVPIGVDFPDQLNCSNPQQPPVAIEAWGKAWEDDHFASGGRPYVRWVWPMTFWSMGDGTLENDFYTPALTGWSRGNPNWGEGPYGDQPQAIGNLGGYFQDTADNVPATDFACGFVTVGSS